MEEVPLGPVTILDGVPMPLLNLSLDREEGAMRIGGGRWVSDKGGCRMIHAGYTMHMYYIVIASA